MKKIKVLAMILCLTAGIVMMASCAEDIKNNSKNNAPSSSEVSESDQSVNDADSSKTDKTNDSDAQSATADSNSAETDAGDDTNQSGGLIIEDVLDLDKLDSENANGSVEPNQEQGWGALMQ